MLKQTVKPSNSLSALWLHPNVLTCEADLQLDNKLDKCVQGCHTTSTILSAPTQPFCSFLTLQILALLQYTASFLNFLIISSKQSQAWIRWATDPKEQCVLVAPQVALTNKAFSHLRAVACSLLKIEHAWSARALDHICFRGLRRPAVIDPASAPQALLLVVLICRPNA